MFERFLNTYIYTYDESATWYLQRNIICYIHKRKHRYCCPRSRTCFVNTNVSSKRSYCFSSSWSVVRVVRIYDVWPLSSFPYQVNFYIFSCIKYFVHIYINSLTYHYVIYHINSLTYYFATYYINSSTYYFVRYHINSWRIFRRI